MKTTKISHCPFCKTFINKVYISEDRSFALVKCNKCGADGPIYHEKIRDHKLSNEEFVEKAIHLWNVGGEEYPPIVNYQIWRLLEC